MPRDTVVRKTRRGRGAGPRARCDGGDEDGDTATLVAACTYTPSGEMCHGRDCRENDMPAIRYCSSVPVCSRTRARQLPLPRHRHHTHTTTFSPDTARRVHRETVSATTQADSVHGRHTAAQRFRLLTHPPLPPPSCHQQLSPGLPARAAAAPLLASTSLERDITTDALPSTQQPGRRGQHQWSARTSDAAGSGPCRGR